MWRLAWRNLWRNRTRTLIVSTAIALTYAMFLISLGMGTEMHNQMERAAAKTAGGDILVHADGFWDAQTNERLIENTSQVLEAVESVDQVSEVIPRVLVNGLLETARGSVAVRVTGMVPELETNLIDISPHLTEGNFFESEEEVEFPIVLGSGIVDDLHLELGEAVRLRASAPNGEVRYHNFYLTDIAHTGSDTFDDMVAYTTVAALQEAMEIGDRITQVGVLIESNAVGDAVRDEVESLLFSGLGLEPPAPQPGEEAEAFRGGVELLTWGEAMPEMVGYIEIDDKFNYIFAIIMLIVVAFGIANSFLMVVMERIRELGLLGALGLAPIKIGRMLLAETIVLALVSMGVGLAMGLGLHWYFMTHGLDLTQMYGGELEISGVAMTDTILRSEIDPVKWTWATIAVFFTVVSSSLYPAWRATRVEPATAMRTYE